MRAKTTVAILLITTLLGTNNLTANETNKSGEYIVADWPVPYGVCQPVPLTSVKANGYIGNRVDRNRASVLRGLDSDIPKNFEAAAAGTPHPNYRLAADSDLYKWLEGACYEYIYTGDQEIRKHIDRITSLIIQVQDEDGYINAQPQKKRWDPNVKHDLYIAGHLFEAAVAHHRATGEKRLLDAACRWADYIIDEYYAGNDYFKTTMYVEHPEYELGFLRLYRETGDKRYLDFSIVLTNYSHVGETVADIKSPDGRHAVRVGYLLAGMADIYMETKREDMIQNLPAIWDELVNTRMYVTGAIGSHGESISAEPYELPQEGGHPSIHRHMGETCASVSMVMFGWRMHGVTAESKYFDVIERILYNHYFGATALNGMGTFYYNTMRVVGDLSTKTDHGHRPMSARCMLPKINRTACCPSNMWRFYGALPEYLFSYDANGVFVNLYTTSSVEHTLPDGREIALSVKTAYPNGEDISVVFDGATATSFALRLRIPEWCETATAEWPGQANKPLRSGEYLTIDRKWEQGDSVKLRLPMPVRMIFPHPQVKANAGQVVFARGPLRYCLEQEDVNFPVEKAEVTINTQEEARAQVKVTWHPDLLDGIHMLHVPGKVDGKEVELPLVPWAVRANRSNDSRWIIWIPREDAEHPYKGIVSLRGLVTASHTYEMDTVDAVELSNKPTSSYDQSIPRWTSWPQTGEPQWVELNLEEVLDIDSFGVYWYHDGGGVKVPEAWYLEARKDPEGPWERVNGTYTTLKNQFNVTKPAGGLNARYIRIRMTPQQDSAVGILSVECKLKSRIVWPYLEPGTFADAGPDRTIWDFDGDGTARVTLDASGTITEPGWELRYTWKDGSGILARGAQALIDLPLGLHTLTLEVDDGVDPMVTDVLSVTVSDDPVPGVSASDFQPLNAPANTLDGDLTTKWSAEGKGQTITYGFPFAVRFEGLQMAFHHGDERHAYFDVHVADDASAWVPLLTGAESSGTTLALESFPIAAGEGRFLRITGQGNSANDWNSYTEVRITCSVVDSTSDGDGDLLPDIWEYLQTGTLAHGGDRTLKGVSLRDTYQSGADPKTGGGPLTPSFHAELPLRLDLEVPPASGYGYDGLSRWAKVRMTQDLTAADWPVVGGAERIAAGPGTVSVPVPQPAPEAAFFKVEYWLE